MNERFSQTREIRKRELHICCPVCGKHRFNMEEGKTSFQCEKCGAYVAAIVKDGKALVYEDEPSLHENVWPVKMKSRAAAGTAY